MKMRIKWSYLNVRWVMSTSSHGSLFLYHVTFEMFIQTAERSRKLFSFAKVSFSRYTCVFVMTNSTARCRLSLAMAPKMHDIGPKICIMQKQWLLLVVRGASEYTQRKWTNMFCVPHKSTQRKWTNKMVGMMMTNFMISDQSLSNV